MSNILTIGYSVEGSTDARFLNSIIQRTFEDIALTCETDIDVYPVVYIPSPKLETQIDNIKKIAADAFKRGMQVLCIHADADSHDYREALRDRIAPAFHAIQNIEGGVCKNLVEIIPVYMSEAWMLADRDLFKEEIGTNKSNEELGIGKRPESIANPKELILNSVRIAQEGFPKKRQQSNIGYLYQSLGQTVSLESLKKLDSYNRFRTSVENALKKLNYLH